MSSRPGGRPRGVARTGTPCRSPDPDDPVGAGGPQGEARPGSARRIHGSRLTGSVAICTFTVARVGRGGFAEQQASLVQPVGDRLQHSRLQRPPWRREPQARTAPTTLSDSQQSAGLGTLVPPGRPQQGAQVRRGSRTRVMTYSPSLGSGTEQAAWLPRNRPRHPRRGTSPERKPRTSRCTGKSFGGACRSHCTSCGSRSRGRGASVRWRPRTEMRCRRAHRPGPWPERPVAGPQLGCRVEPDKSLHPRCPIQNDHLTLRQKQRRARWT